MCDHSSRPSKLRRDYQEPIFEPLVYQRVLQKVLVPSIFVSLEPKKHKIKIYWCAGFERMIYFVIASNLIHVISYGLCEVTRGVFVI